MSNSNYFGVVILGRYDKYQYSTIRSTVLELGADFIGMLRDEAPYPASLQSGNRVRKRKTYYSIDDLLEHIPGGTSLISVSAFSCWGFPRSKPIESFVHPRSAIYVFNNCWNDNARCVEREASYILKISDEPMMDTLAEVSITAYARKMFLHSKRFEVKLNHSFSTLN